MMVDASFLVDIIRGDPGAREFLEQAEAGSEAIKIPSPSLAKLWEAIGRARHAPRDLERVTSVLMAAPTVPFTSTHALRAGRILAASAALPLPMDPLDALVAAMAVEEEEALVTRAIRDFEGIPDLRIRTY